MCCYCKNTAVDSIPSFHHLFGQRWNLYFFVYFDSKFPVYKTVVLSWPGVWGHQFLSRSSLYFSSASTSINWTAKQTLSCLRTLERATLVYCTCMHIKKALTWWKKIDVALVLKRCFWILSAASPALVFIQSSRSIAWGISWRLSSLPYTFHCHYSPRFDYIILWSAHQVTSWIKPCARISG